jgi:hypothetical protein
MADLLLPSYVLEAAFALARSLVFVRSHVRVGGLATCCRMSALSLSYCLAYCRRIASGMARTDACTRVRHAHVAVRGAERRLRTGVAVAAAFSRQTVTPVRRCRWSFVGLAARAAGPVLQLRSSASPVVGGCG